jgi:hypothetical protein
MRQSFARKWDLDKDSGGSVLRAEAIFKGVAFALAEEFLRESGEMRFVACGKEMMPAIFPGEEMILHRARMRDVQVGDVVVFKQRGEWHMERVREILPGVAQPAVLTEADSGRVREEAVFAEELLGRVTFVVRDGEEKVLARRGTWTEVVSSATVKHVPGVAAACLASHQLKVRIAGWLHGAEEMASGKVSGSV